MPLVFATLKSQKISMAKLLWEPLSNRNTYNNTPEQEWHINMATVEYEPEMTIKIINTQSELLLTSIFWEKYN